MTLDQRAYELAADIFKDCTSVSDERMNQHGGIITEYTRLARLWSVILGIDIPPEIAVVMMAVSKANRIACGARTHRDHYLDGSNYFALAWGVHATLKETPDDQEHSPRRVPRCGDPACPNCT